MPPKKQGAKAENKPSANVDEPVLQAVILADSYNRRFEVLCVDQPRILLPMCGIPLLAFTLEALSFSKVKQVFIFCGVHADKIQEFVAASPFNSVLDIQCLSSKTARSGGDALRELDDMNLINHEQPFVLVHGPIVANYDISQMIEAHKKRRAVDPNIIMTMGIGRGGRQHPESPVMLVHPPSSRLLYYSLNPLAPRRHRVDFPSRLFLDPFPKTIDEYEVWSGTSASSSRGGYRDLGVDICEVNVITLSTENFDYSDLRKDFLVGVLTSELMSEKINYHLVGDEVPEDPKERKAQSGRYVERVRDTRTYGEVTQDILRRWVFPLVPDISVPGTTTYELRRGNVYIAHQGVKLSRTTALHGPLLISERSVLGTKTTVNQSTLGKNCHVGANTTIRMSYVFNDVSIGNDCRLDECMVGNGVEIGNGVHIGRGVLIGDGVKIASGVKVPEFARIGRVPYRADDWDSDDEETEQEAELKRRTESVLGADSVGFLWPNEEEETSEDYSEIEDPYEHPANKRLLQLGRRLSNVSASSVSVSTLSVGSSESEDMLLNDMDDSDSDDVDLSRLNIDEGPAEAFYTEARSSLERAFAEGHSVQNAGLELKTLVMGYNSGIDRARQEVVNFLMGKVSLDGGAAKILASATKIWQRWGQLAVTNSRDLSDIALDIQTFCVHNASYMPWFGLFLRALYEGDIVDEDALIEWRSLSAARGEGAKPDQRPAYLEAYAKGKQYVDILEQMDSDDDDDSDDE